MKRAIRVTMILVLITLIPSHAAVFASSSDIPQDVPGNYTLYRTLPKNPPLTVQYETISWDQMQNSAAGLAPSQSPILKQYFFSTTVDKEVVFPEDYFSTLNPAAKRRVALYCNANIDKNFFPKMGLVCIVKRFNWNFDMTIDAMYYVAGVNYRIMQAGPVICNVTAIRQPNGSIDKTLKNAASAALKRKYGNPGTGNSYGHLPDAVFSGQTDRYDPPMWHEGDSRVNSSIGRQQALYPAGYRAVAYLLVDEATGLPFPPIKWRPSADVKQNPNPCP